MTTTREKTKHRWNVIKSYIGWEDYIAISFIILGFIGYFPGPVPSIPHWTNLYMDIRSELIGIGITVLLIDNISEMYRNRVEKQRRVYPFILQMGSPDRSIAMEAVRQLRAQGWLTDGSLIGADLSTSNLQGSNLDEANLRNTNLNQVSLREASLQGANLSGAYLGYADLSETFLNGANLTGLVLRYANLRKASLVGAILIDADLFMADLSDANLLNANLTGAKLIQTDLSRANLRGSKVTNEQLAQAKSIKDAIMPDGRVYDPAFHTEIARLRKQAGLE